MSICVDGRPAFADPENPFLSFGVERAETSHHPLTLMLSAPIHSMFHSLGGWGEPGPALWVPSNDTHYTGVWQAGGGEGPRGRIHVAPCQLTLDPSSSFMSLVPRAGRQVGGEELALGQLASGERRES